MKPQPRYRPGDKIGGRYQVHQALMGGMGEVYLCLDLKENYPYALKTFQQRYQSAALKKAFEQEVATWVALEKHPNIVSCFMMQILDNQPFMILEWIAEEEGKGADLRGWLRHGPLDLKTALEFTIDIVRGLIHAQEKQPGLVHRDLKPENILVAQGGLAKITDFGLVQIVASNGFDVESDGEGRQSMVGKDGIAGTPAYMAPEQWRGEALDERTDIYAVGCILYEMLAGQWPFQATTFDGFHRQHLEAKVPKLVNSHTLSSALDKLLDFCLAKRREERFTTMDNLLRQLNLIFHEEFADSPKDFSSVDEFTAIDYSNRGVTYHRLKRYDLALTDHNQAIQLDPTLAGAYTHRGMTYHNLQMYDKALADYNQAIKLDPISSEAYMNRGNTYDDLHQPDKALADYAQAMQFDPTNSRAHYNRAITYDKLQRYGEALTDYSRAIQLDLNYVSAYINRGAVYADLQQYDEALADHNRAIQLDPINANAYTSRGRTYAKMQWYDEALSDYDQAIQLDPTSPDAYLNRGNTYKTLHQYDEALANYSRAIEVDPADVKAHFNRGLIYYRLHRYDDALVDYNHAIQLDPNDPKAFTNRGATYVALERYDDALIDYRQAIQLDPDDALTYFNIGVAYEGQSRLQEALPYFEKAAQLGLTQGIHYVAQVKRRLKNMPDLEVAPITAQDYHNRGNVYRKLQQYEEALDAYSQAIQLNSTYVDAYFNRANTYEDLQRYEEALADYSQAIQIDSSLVQAYINRGNIYGKQQRYEEALTDFNYAISLKPDLAPAYYNRGVTYSNLNQDEEALFNYNQAIQLDPEYSIAYLNAGVILANQGNLQGALLSFEKAAKLGVSRGARYANQVRNMLKLEPAPQVDLIQSAFEAFKQTTSLETMQQAVARYPFMTQPEFITFIERTIAQQIPPEQRPAYEQRLAGLKQIAQEESQ